MSMTLKQNWRGSMLVNGLVRRQRSGSEGLIGRQTYREKLQSFVVDSVPLIADAEKKSTKILVEGANALMLDIDHGTYPFCTSSATGVRTMHAPCLLMWVLVYMLISRNRLAASSPDLDSPHSLSKRLSGSSRPTPHV